MDDDSGEAWIVDPGGPPETVEAFLQKNSSTPRAVLLTHGHLDHILGLAGLISTFSRWESVESIEIMGGKWALDRIADLLFRVVLRGATPQIDIQLHEIQEGVIFEGDDFLIRAFPVYHRGPDCFGFMFEEKSRRPFLPEKAADLDIPPGPWRRDLVLGKTVTLPDGRVITPDQVLGSERPGTRFMYVGDTGDIKSLLPIAENVDTLVIEATYLEPEAEMAKDFAHLTAKQAATLASQANVKHLILTHVSRRYRERDIIAEAQTVFPNTFVARDFDDFQIIRSDLEFKNLLTARISPASSSAE